MDDFKVKALTITVIAALSVLAMVMLFYEINLLRDPTITATVVDSESRLEYNNSLLRRRHYVTVYDYDLSYVVDGEKYTGKMSSRISYDLGNNVKIKVSSDNLSSCYVPVVSSQPLLVSAILACLFGVFMFVRSLVLSEPIIGGKTLYT